MVTVFLTDHRCTAGQGHYANKVSFLRDWSLFYMKGGGGGTEYQMGKFEVQHTSDVASRENGHFSIIFYIFQKRAI